MSTALSFLDRERTVAPAGYSRWLIPPAALAVHLSIGQAYAFSVFNLPLAARFGLTDLLPITNIFSIAIVMLGLSAAFGGTWVERNGPRKAMALSATCWVAGFLIGALGVYTGQLWLVYLGYGFVGGIGLGIGYISPVSTLIKWFPDRPGLATGIAIMGFGGGALVASPLSTALLQRFSTEDSQADGIVQTFLTLAVIYAVIMGLGAWVIRVPAAGWAPAGWSPAKDSAPLKTTANVSAANAIKTRPFWLLWIILFCNVTAGIGILAQASPIVQAYFDLGDTAAAAAAGAGFVGVLSLCNMFGRILWSSTSDVVGRKNIYALYLGVGAVLYLLVALFGTASIALFVLLTGIILTFYGGGFATIPAYLKDLFGGYQVGAIHGRLLTAWSAAGVAGPFIVSGLRDAAAANGAEGADQYTLSLFIMVGVLIVGFIANLLVRPVDSKYHERTSSDAATDGVSQGATR